MNEPLFSKSYLETFFPDKFGKINFNVIVEEYYGNYWLLWDNGKDLYGNDFTNIFGERIILYTECEPSLAIDILTQLEEYLEVK